MRNITIPIRNLMAEPEEATDFMSMPHEMSTFAMPRLPEPGPDADVAGARDVLQVFATHLQSWLQQGGEPPALELVGLQRDTLKVLNESLGEGEVAAIVNVGDELRVQETVFSGIWRQQHVDTAGRLRHDILLAAPVPPLLQALAQQTSSSILRPLPLPAGAMNVPALVHELQEAVARSGKAVPSHVFNLTLLPLTPEDSAHLDALLEGGSVVILSRGFGNCRISSTAARNVWRVQYFNNMQTLILNTIEVTEMPEVAMAAREDLLESHSRLVELLAWMSESLEAAA
jgi:hydrogenase-1 operon protein HyaF